jgi:hypothetical protein
MAHSFDTQASLAGQTATSISLSYTCGAAAKLLVVCLTWTTSNARTGGAPTYAGVALSRANIIQAGSGQVRVSAEIWYLTKPVTGTTANIVVPNTGAETIAVVASSYIAEGPFQSVLDVSTTATAANSTTPTASVTTTNVGDVIVSVVATATAAQTLTAGSPQTLIASGLNGAAANFGAAYQTSNAVETITASWTSAVSGRYGEIVAAFREASTNSSTLLGVGC